MTCILVTRDTCLLEAASVNQKQKQRLASLVDERIKSAGGQRAYAKKLGVSLIAVQGWIEARSIPNVENLS